MLYDNDDKYTLAYEREEQLAEDEAQREREALEDDDKHINSG